MKICPLLCTTFPILMYLYSQNFIFASKESIYKYASLIIFTRWNRLYILEGDVVLPHRISFVILLGIKGRKIIIQCLSKTVGQVSCNLSRGGTFYKLVNPCNHDRDSLVFEENLPIPFSRSQGIGCPREPFRHLHPRFGNETT